MLYPAELPARIGLVSGDSRRDEHHRGAWSAAANLGSPVGYPTVSRSATAAGVAGSVGPKRGGSALLEALW